MSVVVWDGYNLAADTGAWSNGMVHARSKLFRVPLNDREEVVIGYVGDLHRGRGLVEHIRATRRFPLDAPPPDGMEEVEALVYHVGADKLYSMCEGITPVELDTTVPVAIGNSTACGAVTALIRIAGYMGESALANMVDAEVFDAIAGSVVVETCRCPPEQAPPILTLEDEDAERKRDLVEAADFQHHAAAHIYKLAEEFIDWRNQQFGSPDVGAKQPLEVLRVTNDEMRSIFLRDVLG